MKLNEYIQSGMLERYATGLLAPAEAAGVELLLEKYPELRSELARIEAAIERYLNRFAVAPPGYLRRQTLELLDNINLEHQADAAQLPLINRFSSHLNWLKLVAEYVQAEARGGRVIKVLRQSPQITQILLISDLDFEEEVHEDLHESFLILKGSCRCMVGKQEQVMKPGSFMEIPLFQPHRVELLEPGVTAIVQRIPV